MYYINHEYLSNLENPHEAITEDVWRNWRSNLLDKSVSSEDYQSLLGMSIKTIATNAGVLWKTDSADKIGDILKQDFIDIKNRPHIGKWVKKAITLTIAKLIDFDDDTVRKVVTLPPSSKELDAIALKEAYNESRIKINKYITDARKSVDDTNYDETMKQFIKLVLYEISTLGGFSPDRLKRYLPIAFAKFYYNKTFKEISDTFDTQHGVVNNIINRITDDFRQKIMSTPDELEVFDKKFIVFYEHTFTSLDQTDKIQWAKKLKIMKNFRKYFVGRDLDS